jgi:hypothetical protein
MGAWGTAAWDNDWAADWFGDTFDATGFAKHVEEMLNRDPENGDHKILAAASILVALGRVHIRPVADLDRHLALAISRLEAIRELEIFQEVPMFVEEIDEQIEVLRSRLNPPSTDV